MCSIYVFIHCFGVIKISGQVIGRLLCNMATLTLIELCFTQTQGLYMQLTIFSYQRNKWRPSILDLLSKNF